MEGQVGRDKATLPISMYQHRYWSKWAHRPASSAFNTSLVFEISGPLDRAALERACHFASRQHEIWHATFSEDGSEQYYADFHPDAFFSERVLPAGRDIYPVLRTLLNEPFDLASGPLVRMCLVVCEGEDRSYFVASGHHIITDAVAGKIFITDIMTAYALLIHGRELKLNPYSYADCIQSLHASQTDERRAAAKSFWRELLGDAPLTIDVPLREDAASEDYSSESIFFELTEEVTARLRQFTEENATTLFIVLFAVYGLLLTRYARQNVVVVSYPVNMRPQGYPHVFGCFVNLALLKIAVDPAAPFKTLVASLTEQRSLAKPHVFYRLSDIIHDRGDVRADIEKSYFSVFFGETYINTKPLSLGGLAVKALDIPWSQEFDRELRLLYDAEDAKSIKLRMDFRSARFDRSLIRKFVEDFKEFSSLI